MHYLDWVHDIMTDLYIRPVNLTSPLTIRRMNSVFGLIHVMYVLGSRNSWQNYHFTRTYTMEYYSLASREGVPTKQA
jgi:hypothetical protein